MGLTEITNAVSDSLPGTKSTQGWTIFIAALGTMLGLMAIDISKINQWHEVTAPSFIASFLGHLATVIAAFVGGKLIPSK